MLPISFYERDDVVAISRELLGKVLCTRINGTDTALIITETEAYAGINDRASHAFGGRRTKRTEPMFGPPGRAYVYLCYGIHHLFNVVTNVDGVPHAVLVRAGTALSGLDAMLKRRNKQKEDKTLLAGPGCVAQALGIKTAHTGLLLDSEVLRLEDQGIAVEPEIITVGPRVGVDYAREDASLPYRFRVSARDLL